MALETATYPYDLVITNPTASDPKSQGDDHLRLVKTVLKNAIPGFVGVVVGTATESGSANAYAITLSPAPAAYTALVGALLMFKATHANTGAATLNVNSLGTKPIVDVNGGALASGDIANGSAVACVYDGTSFCLVSANDRGAISGQAWTGDHDFTGATIEVPTAGAGDADTSAASTAFVDTYFAKKASPTFTGTPAVPTATPGTNTTQAASTAFVVQQAFSTALPVQSGSSGKFLTTDGSSASWTSIGGSALALFGDGSDGNVTVSGAVSLAADMYYANLTLAAGAAISTNGYRIFVAGTLDLTAAPAGAIKNNGGDGGAGAASVGTAQGLGGTAGGAAPGNTVGGGGAGQAGGAGNDVNGSTGSQGGSGQNGGPGGPGGAGGSGQAAGGNGASGGGLVAAGAPHLVRTALTASDQSTTLLTAGSGGGSAGGGCGTSGIRDGGGGGGSGGGGGIVQVYARYINRGAGTATGAIQAKGGAGGAGGSINSSNTGGGGGGSGGGGGWVYILCETLLGSTATNAVDISGGQAGSGGNGNGSGTGGKAGGYGGAGRFTLAQLFAATVADTGVGSAGAVVNNSGTTGGVAATAPVTRSNL